MFGTVIVIYIGREDNCIRPRFDLTNKKRFQCFHVCVYIYICSDIYNNKIPQPENLVKSLNLLFLY